MNTLRRVRKSLWMAVALTLLCVVFMARSAAAVGPDEKTISAKLQKVQELRRVVLVRKSEHKPPFDFNPPGIELTFSVVPPAGKKLIRVEQPSRIEATDSTKRDLTEIKAGVFGRKDFLKFVEQWNDVSTTVTLTLANAHRTATRFSVSADFEAWAYDELQEITIKAGSEPLALDAALFGGRKVVARLEKSGDNPHLIITPGTIKHHIERVELMDGDTVYDGMGAMWNDASATFMFSGTYKPTLTAKIKIRAGMEKFPCRIAVKNHALP